MTENERQANNIVYYVDLYKQGHISAEELVIHMNRQHFVMTHERKLVHGIERIKS